MLAGPVDTGAHADTDAEIGVDDGRLCDGVPGEARLDAQSALGSDAIVEHAGLRKEQMRGNGCVTTVQAMPQTASRIGDVFLDVAGEGAFEDDEAHAVRSAVMVSNVRSLPSRRAFWPVKSCQRLMVTST